MKKALKFGVVIIIVVIIIVVILFNVFVDVDFGDDESKEATVETVSEMPPTPSIDDKMIVEGTYKVGKDIKVGEYYAFATDENGYLEVLDGSGEDASTVTNVCFENNAIITVKEGEYLKIEEAYAYREKDAGEVDKSKWNCALKVGRDIKAGEYKLIPSENGGYYELYADSRMDFGEILKNDTFDGQEYISLKNGQYIVLEGCKIKKS